MKFLFYANTDWYLYNFRAALAVSLLQAGHEVLMVSPEGPYGERIQALGLPWVPAPMRRTSLNPLREVKLIFWLRNLILRENVDVVHGFTIKCAVYGAIAARFSGDRARVSAVAGLGYVFTSEDLKARTLRPAVRMIMRFAFGGDRSRLILQNPDDVATFERMSLVDPLKIRLIRGSGVDCSRFSSGPPRENREPLRVLLAARLLWDKGIRNYVEAAHELKAQGRTILFFLAGRPDSGNPSSIPESEICQWEDQGLLKWLGHVDDVPKLLRSMDVMVLPSHREGLPRTLIEAAAAGLALVTTDAPGCREVVTNEVDGLLIPLRDSKALAVAIARLDDDPELLSRLGSAGKAKALAEFDEHIVIRKTMDVYEELLPFDSGR